MTISAKDYITDERGNKLLSQFALQGIIDSARNSALEESAKLVEEFAIELDDLLFPRHMATGLSHRIRSLKTGGA